MGKVISRDSVRRANCKIMDGTSRSISMDSTNVSMKCRTSFGTRDIVISKEKITNAASSALRKTLSGKL